MVKASLVGVRGRALGIGCSAASDNYILRADSGRPDVGRLSFLRSRPPSRRPLPMPSMLAVAGIVTLLLAAYLIVAMLAPEWFA